MQKLLQTRFMFLTKFKYDDRFELILTGGTYRSKTGSFTGTIANDFMETIYLEKAFIGVNAINDNKVFNANEDEGVIQRIVLNNARKKYLVADSLKFNSLDFYQFYDLDTADYLVTDSKLSPELKEKYSQWVQIIN
jgi:Transcriptional regulators of sugar metabolism